MIGHAWPTRLPGGYVGVDVFFVISGFLITSHLAREVISTGRVRLGAFYARRVRRLLPAAFFVLIVSLIAVWLFLPSDRWGRNALEIGASAAYVENWVLAGLAVDYSAANEKASLVQHYWSLSVEEQFYLVWPLLFLIGALALRRWWGVKTRILVIVAAVTVMSLIASVISTAHSPQPAYFQTFTRAWEFGVGALIALLPWRPSAASARWFLASLGWIGIVAFALTFTATTPMPGTAALLPVLSTAAVIVAGAESTREPFSRLTGLWPIQQLGKISYSLYLWHWPILIVLPFVVQAEMSLRLRLTAVVLSIVAAATTYALIEAPAQRLIWWRTSTRRSFIAMAVGMATIMSLSTFTAVTADQREQSLIAAATPTGPCAGAGALDPQNDCGDPFAGPIATVMTDANAYYASPPECQAIDLLAQNGQKSTARCDFSDGTPSAEVWLVGDSHAEQWKSLVFALAKERDWLVTYSFKGGCPSAEVAWQGFRAPATSDDQASCLQWQSGVIDAIIDEAPDYVFTSMAARQMIADDGSGQSSFDQLVSGLDRTWDAWTAAGIAVYPIADAPLNAQVRGLDCVALNSDHPQKCDRPREQSQPADPILVAAGLNPDVSVIDMTPAFCDAQRCWAAAGGIPVFYDGDHLNRWYTLLLRDSFAAQLDGARP